MMTRWENPGDERIGITNAHDVATALDALMLRAVYLAGVALRSGDREQGWKLLASVQGFRAAISDLTAGDAKEG